MTLKQLLLFDITRILRWDVGRVLQSDITTWRVPALLLRAILGLSVSGVILAVTVPYFARRGYHLNEWVALVVIASSVALFTLPGRRRRT